MILMQPAKNREETAEQVGELLEQALTLMHAVKPQDRSVEDRYWAIAITDMQKLLAFFNAQLKPVLYAARGRSKGELHLLAIKATEREAELVCEKWNEFYQSTYVEKWHVGDEVDSID